MNSNLIYRIGDIKWCNFKRNIWKYYDWKQSINSVIYFRDNCHWHSTILGILSRHSFLFYVLFCFKNKIQFLMVLNFILTCRQYRDNVLISTWYCSIVLYQYFIMQRMIIGIVLDSGDVAPFSSIRNLSGDSDCHSLFNLSYDLGQLQLW